MSGSPSQVQKIILEPGELQVRRKPGDVPYPVVRSGSASAFEIWDSMYCWAACRGPSMIQFDTTPRTVLDLGCGTGYWAIETAQRWKKSRIYGFDISNTQPSQRVLNLTHPDIASRVIWVRGNFLEPLPFQSESFDFVRIANIGLGVPEDEWPSVLKEVARVMKPGAAVEIIEDAPIFPCIQRPLPPKTTSGRPQLTVTINHSTPSLSSPNSYSPFNNSSGSTILSPDHFGSILDKQFDIASSTLSSKSLASSLSLGPPLRKTSQSHSPYGTFLTPSYANDSFEEEEPIGDPWDHSTLKAAWEELLYSRFFVMDPSAILQFHMTSAAFVDVQLRPLAKVELPPPSDSVPPVPRRRHSDESTSSCRGSSSSQETSTESASSELDSSNWNRMHLGKIFETICSCKDAIWQEYRKLWNPNRKIVGGRTTVGPSKLNQESAAREAFEEDWRAWENDMMNRIGFRALVTSSFGWKEPSGPDPDWRRWSSLIRENEASDSRHCGEEQNLASDDRDSDICRSICGIVAWKAGVDSSL